jgi:hypothetical protein
VYSKLLNYYLLIPPNKNAKPRNYLRRARLCLRLSAAFRVQKCRKLLRVTCQLVSFLPCFGDNLNISIFLFCLIIYRDRAKKAIPMDRDFDCGFAGFSDNVIRKPQDFATEAKSTVKKSGNVLNSARF